MYVSHELISMLTFCLAASITPGPNTLMLMTSSLNHGVARSWPHFWGVILGFNFMLATIALGLGAVFTAYPMAHQIIKILGGAYLLYLAWKIATSSGLNEEKSRSEPLTFWQAVLFQWLNPKAWIISVGAVASFTQVGEFIAQFLRLLVVFFTVGTASMLVWLFFGALLNRLIHNDKVLTRFNIAMGLLLAASLVPMLGVV